jgi:hypothetical protein
LLCVTGYPAVGEHANERHQIPSNSSISFFPVEIEAPTPPPVGVTDDHLRALSQSDYLYSEYDIPKKPNKKRRVEEPRGDLKKVQARIANLLARIQPADYLYCPAKRRCYVTNAARHQSGDPLPRP